MTNDLRQLSDQLAEVKEKFVMKDRDARMALLDAREVGLLPDT